MGRGRNLSDHERSRISAFRELGLSNSAIATRLGRSRKAVRNVINHDPNREIQRRGRKRKLSDRDVRQIHRLVSNRKITSAAVKRELQLEVSTRTIRERIRESPHIKRQKLRRGPVSNDRTKQVRLAWAQAHAGDDQNWDEIIFSDEKKFNLDGPDGYNYYYHDNRKEKLRMSTRQSGGGGVMFWGAIGAHGLSPLVKVEGRMNSESYTTLLEANLLPCAQRIAGQNFTFQQDGAPCHRSRHTINWLRERNIQVLEWPAYSPDLNIIENLWGIMSQRVYADGARFRDVQSVETVCQRVWREIDQELINNLFESLPRRLNEVIDNRGGLTSF
jgi:transposase